MFDAVVARFLQQSPLTVMTRLVMERALEPDWVDRIFAQHRHRQYTRELLFSMVVDVASVVAMGLRPSLHAALKKTSLPTSLQAFYGKVNRTEPALMRALVRGSFERLAPVLHQIGLATAPLVEGMTVRLVDGTDLPASEKRIMPLRGFRGAALPGQSLVVYDPDLGLVCDLLAVEDAHAHERALMVHLLDAVVAGQLWLADRGFSTRAIMRAIASRSAFFLMREHARNPHPTDVGPRRCLGRVETGVVYEQAVEIPGDEDHPPLRLRRIELHLDTPTDDGQRVLRLLTNVAAKRLNGCTLATLYRSRWRIEGMFQKLESALESEVRSLGVPNGALLAFCVAVVTFNVLRMLEAAVHKAHPTCAAHPVSTFHIAAEVRENYGGLKIAVPSEYWTAHQALSDKHLARMLIQMAKRVDVVAIRKDVRGPKTRTKKGYAPAKVARRHVATARVLAAGTVDYDTC